MCKDTTVLPDRHGGLEYYHVTFFDGRRARRDQHLWLVQADAEAATDAARPGRAARRRLMLNAINALRLAPQDMQWPFFNFRRIPLPPVIHITN